MNIIRSIDSNGNINTELLNVIESIPAEHLYFSQHTLRKPQAIYTISTTRVFTAFDKLVNSINNSNGSHDYAEKHNELIESLNSYIDDSFHIMKCLFPKNSVNKKIIFADKWLKEVNESVKIIINNYQSEISPYKNLIAKINNKIKHNHARYCNLEVSTLYGKIYGYYIEGVNLNGIIIPDSEIHRTLKDGTYTAISYNYDIKKLLVYFYIISSIMSTTICKLYAHIHSSNLKIIRTSENKSNIIKICKKVSELKDLFFPDEYNKNIPQVIIKNNNSEIVLRKTAYKSHINKLNRIKYKNYSVEMGFIYDGASNTYALPYK